MRVQFIDTCKVNIQTVKRAAFRIQRLRRAGGVLHRQVMLSDADTEAALEFRLSLCHVARDVEHFARLGAGGGRAVGVRAGLTVRGGHEQQNGRGQCAFGILARHLFIGTLESAQQGFNMAPAEQIHHDEHLPIFQSDFWVLQPAGRIDRTRPLPLDVRQ